jgi:hypothetical protein
VTTTIILDTNFLLVPGQFGVDIFQAIEEAVDEPYELAIVDGTIDELDDLARGAGDDARAATVGKRLVQEKGIKTLHGSGHVDDILVEHATDGALVATQDRELRRRIDSAGGRVLILRNKSIVTEA